MNEHMRGLKPHHELFGFRSVGRQVRLERMDTWDVQEDNLYASDIMRDCGVKCELGDWLMHIYVEDDGAYECRSLDPQAALGDISRVIKHTGAVIVAMITDPCENGTVDVTVLLRGGKWDDVHPGDHECFGCKKPLWKELEHTSNCAECEDKRVKGWQQWRVQYPPFICEKCGKETIVREDRGKYGFNPVEEPDAVHWKACLRAHCPHYKDTKCGACGKPTYSSTMRDGALRCIDDACPSNKEEK